MSVEPASTTGITEARPKTFALAERLVEEGGRSSSRSPPLWITPVES